MAKTTKKPIKNGVARVPVVMQLEALECGAACLCMVLAYYGKWIPIEQARDDCGVSRDGSNVANVMKAAEYYGLEANGYRFEIEALKEHGTFPCIIHWNFNHFVVLDGFRHGKAYINDPGKGCYSVSMDTFDESFTGICIMFEPTDRFVPSGRPKSMFSFAAKRLKGTRTAIIFTVLTGMIAAMLSFIQPAFSRVFLDRLLTGKDPEWFRPFLIILCSFNILQILMSALQEIYSLRLNGKMAAVSNAGYMWKILKMPMRFFTQRASGDIQQRQLANTGIANTLINITAPLVLNAVMMVLYLIIMLRYSVVLSAVGVAAITVNIIISIIIAKKRINITRVAMHDSAKLASYTISGIDMIETIKSSGTEDGFFKKWTGYQANVNTQQVRERKLEQYLGVLQQFVLECAAYTVLFLGVFLTMQGEFTVGMVMAFQGFLVAFMTPAQTFVASGQMIQEMRSQMERVDDVMEYPDDNIFDETVSSEGWGKLSGNIELKNIVFGYSPLAEPLIKDFNLTVTSGKSVAIVGASGCGKSTMSKLISGLYRPWEGEILFDGKPISEIPKNIFRASLSVIDQDVILFKDTIANNIKIWDNSIEDYEMILAARDAQIHDDIMKKTGGYQHKLIDGGKDLSGGQRQRMEIAAALAEDPTIVIFDEATSALDAQTEYQVVKAVKERGITCIVIAHRLSTIRSCDEIIVMDQGEIKDMGTHQELMEKSGIYRNLVIAE